MRETVVPPNRALGVFVLLFLVGAAGGLGLASISVSEADEWSEYLAQATALTALSWALLLVASTRVDGIGDQLKIVNFFVTITVPADRVRGAEAENGLAVVLDDETRIECVAYGSSPGPHPEAASCSPRPWAGGMGVPPWWRPERTHVVRP